MIRRSPSEYYIKYLVVSGLDNLNVRKVCERHGLVSLGDWYINDIRARCRIPNPFRPEDPTHTPTREFLTREMIKLAFHPDDTMKKVLKILEKPRLREVVEVMVMSGAPTAATVYALEKRHRFICSEYAIGLYRHYFWDVDLLDSNEMRVLLKLKYEEVLSSTDPQIRLQYDSLKKTFHSDPRVVSSRLPMSPITGMLAQLSVGVMPKGLNVVEILEKVRLISLMRALESSLIGGPAGAEQGTSYMSMADIASRMLETVVKPEEQLRDELLNIALQSSSATVPVIHQLSSGSHTVDIAPPPKTANTEMALTEEEEDDPIDI
jgi:hypothetical protein